jgi:hypothetical protein
MTDEEKYEHELTHERVRTLLGELERELEHISYNVAMGLDVNVQPRGSLKLIEKRYERAIKCLEKIKGICLGE